MQIMNTSYICVIRETLKVTHRETDVRYEKELADSIEIARQHLTMLCNMVLALFTLTSGVLIHSRKYSVCQN